MSKEFVKKRFEQSIELKKQVKEKFSEEIFQIAQILSDCLKQGGKILLCGNGGSASDSQHIATELVVRLKSNSTRSPLPAIALTTNSSILTACANDFGFEFVFSRQIEALGKKGDCLLALSTSGNSLNISQAVKKAKELGIKTIALLGGSGGEVKNLTDISLIVPSPDSQRVQEVHITIGHILVELIEENLMGQE
jgi:D-sedoheptulose 7-phosphate isomerase